MNLPAMRVGANDLHTVDTLPLENPPRVVPARRISLAASDTALSDGAFRVYTIALIAFPEGAWVSVLDLAGAAGMREHQARQRVGELVRFGLLDRRRMVVVSESGAPVDVRRYRTAGAAS